MTSTTITLADGRRAILSGSDPVTGNNSISVQFTDASGQPVGAPQVIAQGHGFNGGLIAETIDVTNFTAAPLSGGGFEIAYYDRVSDTSGFSRIHLIATEVGGDGHVIADSLVDRQVDFPFLRAGGAQPTTALVQGLTGDRAAVVYETFDDSLHTTTHLTLVGPHGFNTELALTSRPDAITAANGDITLSWNVNGTVEREVLSPTGQVLAERGVSQVVTAHTDGLTEPGVFDQAHDQIRLLDASGGVAHGTTSTLTFDARTHLLTWDQDSEGPAAPTTAAVLEGVNSLSVANLASDFRPEVLKVFAADGSQSIQWFDSDNSQIWDTLFATKNAAGDVTTYASTLDDGTSTVFHFDVDASQPWQRYVDQLDARGHVLDRTVLVDNGQSWTAHFTYHGDEVFSYEVDSFDVNGQLVSRGFFHADGTPI